MINFKKWYKEKGGKSLIMASRHNKDIQTEIFERTSFLSDTASVSERLFVLINDINEQLKCKYCDKNLKFHKLNKGYYGTCQTKICIKKHRGAINRESSKKINWNESLKKQKETNIKRYNTEHVWNKGSKSRETYKLTMLKKYKVKYPLQNKEILKKQQDTVIKKFGTLDFLHSEKTLKTLKGKYGTTNIMHVKEIRDKVIDTQKNKARQKIEKNLKNINKEIITYSSTFLKLKCIKCGGIITYNRTGINYFIRNEHDPCQTCNPIENKNYFKSNGEHEIKNFLDSLELKNIELNRKYMLNGTEIDIYLPDYNLGIEYNGVYWHSELFKHKTYHNEKKKLGYTKGINIINIWEDDWNDNIKRMIIKSRLTAVLGKSNKLFARKCQIKNINHNDAKEFFCNNHLQGYTNSKIKIGLYFEHKLVSLMTFSLKKTKWELSRFANLKEYSVIGAFSKLLSYFIKNYKPTNLFTYADLDWSDFKNNVYEKNNFKFLTETVPSYFWVDGGKRIHRLNYSKQKLINLGFDKDKTEIEIMHSLKKYRIWNCGNLKYEFMIL